VEAGPWRQRALGTTHYQPPGVAGNFGALLQFATAPAMRLELISGVGPDLAIESFVLESVRDPVPGDRQNTSSVVAADGGE
jgi:hypothetical protein